MKEKMKWIMTWVILCVLLAAIAFNTVNSRRALQTISDLNVLVRKSQEEEKTQEDNVIIGEIYRVESTVHISDAYKSGDTSGLADRDKETLDMASAVLSQIIKDDMTPYEKERAVYDWMTRKLQFDQGSLVVIPTSQADCDKPYGVLKYHNAVCVGYATTFRLFLQMLDIECMVVHNTIKNHTWNLVKLDNEWYHTDIYSDAGNGSYTNFNLNDAMTSQNQDWDTTFFPVAQGLKYNAGYQNRQELTDIYLLPTLVKDMLDSENSSCCFVGFEGGFQSHEMILADRMMTMIQDRLWETELSNHATLTYSWVNTQNEGCYLSLSVTKTNTGADGEIDPDEYAQMEDAVNELFAAYDSWDEEAVG